MVINESSIKNENLIAKQEHLNAFHLSGLNLAHLHQPPPHPGPMHPLYYQNYLYQHPSHHGLLGNFNISLDDKQRTMETLKRRVTPSEENDEWDEENHAASFQSTKKLKNIDFFNKSNELGQEDASNLNSLGN